LKKTILLAAAGCICSIALAAVPKPDFSGTWKLNNDKSTRDGPADRIYLNEIRQDSKSVTVTTKVESAPPGVPLDGTFLTDGKERVDTKSGHLHSTQVVWEGTTLVFMIVDKEGRKKTSKPTNAIRESWTLSPDGKVLTKFRQTAGGGKMVEQKYVFDKQ